MHRLTQRIFSKIRPCEPTGCFLSKYPMSKIHVCTLKRVAFLTPKTSCCLVFILNMLDLIIFLFGLSFVRHSICVSDSKIGICQLMDSYAVLRLIHDPVRTSPHSLMQRQFRASTTDGIPDALETPTQFCQR